MPFIPPGSVGTLPLADIAGMTGRETLEAVRSGLLPMPPIGRTLSFWLSEVGEGRVVFSGEPQQVHLNPLGTVHGGWIGTLLDSAMACAVHTCLKVGETYTSTSMTVNFVRALLPDSGLVHCEGKVIHRGNRLATAEGRLLDAKGRLIAHGSETCLIMPLAVKTA